MSIISRSICVMCRVVRTTNLQPPTLDSSKIINKLLQPSIQYPALSACASVIQKRCMASKFRKEPQSVHRKDGAVIGEGDKMYEPQSPYREPWPKYYGWENKLFAGGALPKVDDLPQLKDVKQKKDRWDKQHALFGQNDYIDILGDGNLRPVDLMRGPSWLRGFRGNEMQRIIRRLQFQQHTLRSLYPTKFHQLKKRLDYLYKHYNIHRSNKIGKGFKRVQK